MLPLCLSEKRFVTVIEVVGSVQDTVGALHPQPNSCPVTVLSAKELNFNRVPFWMEEGKNIDAGIRKQVSTGPTLGKKMGFNSPTISKSLTNSDMHERRFEFDFITNNVFSAKRIFTELLTTNLMLRKSKGFVMIYVASNRDESKSSVLNVC
jgi:hypothetical protein